MPISSSSRLSVALSGLGLLVFGVFSPVIDFGFGTLNYYADGEGDGVIILILSALSLPFVLVPKLRYGLWVTGLLMLATIGYDFFHMMDSLFGLDVAGWGWIPLWIGVLLVLAAAAMSGQAAPVCSLCHRPGSPMNPLYTYANGKVAHPYCAQQHDMAQSGMRMQPPGYPQQGYFPQNLPPNGPMDPYNQNQKPPYR